MSITANLLEELRLNQQKSHYGSEASAMFKDGKFNPDNWNGGDGLVRQYFGYIDGKVFCDQVIKEVAFNYDEENEFSGTIIVNHTIHDDSNYASIILDGHLYSDENSSNDKVIEDVIYLSWYKSRGKTDKILYNGNPINETEYTILLNALESTGYEFSIKLYR